MIRELTYLSPAEILLIEDPNVKADELARVTFLNLVLKEVLKIEVDPKATKKEKKNPTIGIGKSFYRYQPLKHETIFLSIFNKDGKLKIQLSNLLKIAFENIKSSNEYRLKYVYSKKRMQPYFKSNLFEMLFGIKVISEKGIEVQKEIKKELRRIKTNTTKKHPSSIDSLLAINDNIVLIPKIPLDTFKKIEKKKSSLSHENLDSTWIDFSYSGVYYNDMSKNQFDIIPIKDADFMPIIESVDGFSDSSGDSGGSGCGSDGGGCSSGCGGGGCGGCGGCG